MINAEIGSEYIFRVVQKNDRTKFLQSDALSSKILQNQELILQQNKLKKQDIVPLPVMPSAPSSVVSTASTVLIEEHEENTENKDPAPNTSRPMPKLCMH